MHYIHFLECEPNYIQVATVGYKVGVGLPVLARAVPSMVCDQVNWSLERDVGIQVGLEHVGVLDLHPILVAGAKLDCFSYFGIGWWYCETCSVLPVGLRELGEDHLLSHAIFGTAGADEQ